MWLFSKSEKLSDPVSLPKFGETKKCPACGHKKFVRRFAGAIMEIGLPARVVATCNKCGWYTGERMKSDS